MSDPGDSVDPMTPDIELLDLQGWKDRRTRLYQVFQRFRSKVTLGIKLEQETVPSLYAAMEDAFGDVYHAHQQLVDFCTKNKVPDTLPGHELSKTSIVNKMALVPWLAHAEAEYNATVALYKTYVLSLVPAAPAAPQAQAQAQSSATPNPPVITSATASSTPLTGQTLRQLTSLYEKESWRFLGNPGREWAEWKCIYLCEIKPLFVGRPIALAQLLRILVKGGYGEKVISHVTLQEEKPDEKIFTALCSHYDNVGMNVACALSSFASLRASSDPQGIIENIRKIQSAHSQLQALGHTTQVDQTRVTQLVELFPASIQEQWYERFSDFDDQEKFHPLQQFVDFLKEKFASLEAKAICTRSMHPGRTQNKSSVRSHAMSSSSVDKNCVVHPNGNHSTQSCREFEGLSPKDRSRLCTKHKKCKLCLLDKHEGPCHADFSCTRCTGKLRNSHCTQLCFANESSKTPSAQASTQSVDKPYGSSQGKQFAPRSGHANAVDSSSSQNQSPGTHNISQAGIQPQSQFGYPYMHPMVPYPGMFPYFPGAQNPAFHVGINQVANPHASPNVAPVTGSPRMYPVPYVYPGIEGASFPHMGFPHIASHGVSTDHSNLSSGPNNGANETTAKSEPSHSVSDKKSAELKHINLSSNLSSMQINVFKVTESKQTAEPEKIPFFDNILAAPRPKAFGLYAIVSCKVARQNNHCVIFMDGGSDCALIKESSVGRLCARTVARGTMNVTTINGTETLDTTMVEVDLIDIAGLKRTVVGYTVKEIMGRPYQLNPQILEQEFPDYDPSCLQRPKQDVDILLGADYFTLFPKQELANNGKDLSIMFGPLGMCVQGSHPHIVKKSNKSSSNPFAHSVNVTFHAADASAPRSDFPVHHLLRTAGIHTCQLLPPARDTFIEPPSDRLTDPSCESLKNAPQAALTPDSSTPPSSLRVDAVDVTCTELVGSAPAAPDAGESVTESPSCPLDVEVPLTPEAGPLADAQGDAGSCPLPPVSACVPVRSPLSPRGADVIPHGAGTFSELSVGSELSTLISGPLATFALATGVSEEELEQFILGEHLGTTCFPRCGSCRCAKCPLPGHSFSFKEEQELQLIQSKMRYLADPGRWITGYPWVVPPESLPDNYVAAYSTLCRTERTLARDPAWQATYQLQIEDHLARGVARKLTPEEIAAWDGPVFYLSHMALEQPKSESTPVRLVFNSSQKYRGVSLNSCLAKGPDCYNCTLLGMLIRFREYPTVLIGDIKKMYNTVWLEELEQHMHRFLWRECDSTRKPDIWCITRVNLGDKPSGTIAITAKNNTAHMFAHICPEAAAILIYFCYTDDIIASIPENLAKAIFLSSKCEEILKKAEFTIKEWFFAGRDVPLEYIKKELKQILGLWYNLPRDCIFFPVKLNFSPKRRNVPTGPDLTRADLPQGVPLGLTRRIVLQQVMAVYDPLGLLAPLVLQAKLLLRDTWLLKLGWDDVLTPHMVSEWRKFFFSLFDASEISFDRCLTPRDAVGQPQLILMSDGSDVAYGCTAYVRWELSNGQFWCRLLMAKSRIAPINRISIPRMELNGAVVSKRLRETIQEESRFQFSKVHHLVDSETVLCQLYKVASRFQVFEGVRIGEIQAAMKGDMTEWAWIAGSSNAADLATRPQPPSALGPESVWQRGPDFLYLPESQWPIKRNPRINESEQSPGEKAFCNKVSVCPVHDVTHSSLFSESLTRTSSTETTVGAVARILVALRAKSFNAQRSSGGATPEIRSQAFRLALQEAQCSVWTTEKQVRDQFRQIRPVLDNGLWTVGSRDPRKLILSTDHLPQVLLPRSHIISQCLMRDAHISGSHCGRDRTLCLFRARFHTSRAHKLAEKVAKSCQECKRRYVKLSTQRMGCPPPARFVPGTPFNSSVLDMFGPYDIRDAVNKRTTSKIYGILIVDLCSRASHIEIAAGYDTDNFLLAFQRFAALRGWPAHIYSDPGSQLKGASTDVTQPLEALATERVRTTLARSGTEWHFGPADSPWYQGAAEALIKSAKSAISAAIRGRRMGLAEMLTVFTRAANLLNERPIGYLPSLDNEINILTPNNLLLGRSASANPGVSDAVTPSIAQRLHVVNDAVDCFWQKWTELYAPTLIKQSKWMDEARPFQKDDIVLVADSNVMKGEYRVAVVHEVHPSQDGVVRRVSIRYMIYRTVTPDMKLVNGRPSIVERSAQRLSLLVPVSSSKIGGRK